jgi:Rab-GTPase-TBC domain
MNEIVGTLYYVLANDFNDEWADHAEADTYILFNAIMSETRDIYVADMDNADTGIVGRIDNMQNLLRLHDPTVKSHLDNLGIEASFYAVRWLTTLLSREFLLPDTIRLWDSMFASTHKENFLRYVSVAMVLKIRDELLQADFATALQLLQKYPTCNMDELLDSSRALWIYESQITMACVKGGLTLHQALQAIPPPDKVIMGFGLRGGVAFSNREHLEKASANAKEAVKNNVERARQGMQTLSSASQGLLGGARKFLQGRTRTHSSDEIYEEASDARHPGKPQRGMFRNFSFGGRAASEGSEAMGNGKDDNDDAPDIPPTMSDAETV